MGYDCPSSSSALGTDGVGAVVNRVQVIDGCCLANDEKMMVKKEIGMNLTFDRLDSNADHVG